MLRAVSRQWRAAEAERARGPRAGFAPASAVARAVATLFIEAAVRGAGTAAAAAAVGCAEGVGRMVDVALARLVLDAMPGQEGRVRVSREAMSTRPAPFAPAPRLPITGWWARDPGFGLAEGALGPAWPPVPGGPPAARRLRGASPGQDQRLQEMAWRVLEEELRPGRSRWPGGVR